MSKVQETNQFQWMEDATPPLLGGETLRTDGTLILAPLDKESASLEDLFNTVEKINHMKRPQKPICKAPFDMIPPIALLEEARAFGYSDAKSARDYWEQEVVKFSEIYSEMQQHLLSWYNGEDIDPSSGCPHIANLRKCTAKILYLISKGKYIDDRFNVI